MYKPDVLVENLNEPYPYKITDHAKGGGEVEIEAVINLSLNGGAGKSLEYYGDSVQQIIKKFAGGTGLVLVLDEAQNLEFTRRRSEGVMDDVSVCLDAIHNGRVGARVVLLAGGLGVTEKMFNAFGVTRFLDFGVHLLGTLDNSATEAVIRDWLVSAGGSPGDHPHLTNWTEVLAAESQGWPQHLYYYGRFAAEWLLTNEHLPAPQVPQSVLKKAQERRSAYYLNRVANVPPEVRISLAKQLAELGKSLPMKKSEVHAALGSHVEDTELGSMFNLLLHRGVIAETAEGYFQVPIPSMHDWLVHRYAGDEKRQLAGHHQGVLRPHWQKPAERDSA